MTVYPRQSKQSYCGRTQVICTRLAPADTSFYYKMEKPHV